MLLEASDWFRWPNLYLLVMGKAIESTIKEQIRNLDLGRHVQLVGFVEDLEHVLPASISGHRREPKVSVWCCRPPLRVSL